MDIADITRVAAEYTLGIHMSAACPVHAREPVATTSSRDIPLPFYLSGSKISKRYRTTHHTHLLNLEFTIGHQLFSCTAVVARQKKEHSRQASLLGLAVSEASGLVVLVLLSGVQVYTSSATVGALSAISLESGF